MVMNEILKWFVELAAAAVTVPSSVSKPSPPSLEKCPRTAISMFSNASAESITHGQDSLVYVALVEHDIIPGSRLLQRYDPHASFQHGIPAPLPMEAGLSGRADWNCPVV